MIRQLRSVVALKSDFDNYKSIYGMSVELSRFETVLEHRSGCALIQRRS